MKTLEPGIAFVRKPGNFIRGTFNGKYLVIRPATDLADDAVTADLKFLFDKGLGKPIPADGFPAELVIT